MKNLSSIVAKKAYRETLKKAKNKTGLERGLLIFSFLKNHADCSFTKWNYNQEMINRCSDNQFAVNIMRGMISNIDENILSRNESIKKYAIMLTNVFQDTYGNQHSDGLLSLHDVGEVHDFSHLDAGNIKYFKSREQAEEVVKGLRFHDAPNLIIIECE